MLQRLPCNQGHHAGGCRLLLLQARLRIICCIQRNRVCAKLLDVHVHVRLRLLPDAILGSPVPPQCLLLRTWQHTAGSGCSFALVLVVLCPEVLLQAAEQAAGLHESSSC